MSNVLLTDLMNHQVDEIPRLLDADLGLKQQILSYLDDVSNLSELCQENQEPAKLKTLFSYLIANHHFSAEQFFYLANTIPNARSKSIFFNAIQEKIHILINSAADFELIMRGLTGDEHEQIYLRERSQIYDLSKNATDFMRMMNSLSDKQRAELIPGYLYGLIPNLFRSPEDLMYLMSSLDEKQRALFYYQQKSKIFDFITSPTNFELISQALDEAQNTEVYNTLRTRILNFIKQPNDIAQVISWLNKDLGLDVLYSKKQLIVGYNDFLDSLVSIKSLFMMVYHEGHKAALKDITQIWSREEITNVSKLQQALGFFPDEEFSKIIISAVAPRFPSFIRSAKDFDDLMNLLDQEQRKHLSTQIKSSLSGLVKSSTDFELIAKHLDEGQCASLYRNVQDKVNAFIHSAEDYEKITRHLNKASRNIVYLHARDKITSLVSNAKDFVVLSKGLNEAQFNETYQRIGERFTKTLNSASALSEIVSALETEEQRHWFLNNPQTYSHLTEAKDYAKLLDSLGTLAKNPLPYLELSIRQLMAKPNCNIKTLCEPIKEAHGNHKTHAYFNVLLKQLPGHETKSFYKSLESCKNAFFNSEKPDINLFKTAAAHAIKIGQGSVSPKEQQFLNNWINAIEFLSDPEKNKLEVNDFRQAFLKLGEEEDDSEENHSSEGMTR